jgi:hypothetical protein
MIHTGKGATLRYVDAVSGITAYVAQMRSVSGPTAKAKMIDVTPHGYGNVGGAITGSAAPLPPVLWRRQLAAMMDAGDLTFEINWDAPAVTHSFNTGFWNAMVNNYLIQWELTFPYGAGILDFNGYVTGHEFAVPVDNVLSAKIAIAITDGIEVMPSTPVPPNVRMTEAPAPRAVIPANSYQRPQTRANPSRTAPVTAPLGV